MRCVVAVVSLLSGLVAAGPAGAATWTVQPSPSIARSELLGVSCGSAHDCLAVGDRTVGGHTRTLAEHWNGSAWSVTPLAVVGGASLSVLQGVDCRSAHWCMAVGFSRRGGTEKPLAERWSGTRWSILPTPDPSPSWPRHRLYGVSCPTTRFCLAAGDFGTETLSPFFTSTFKAWVVRWNGSRWSVAHVINAPKGTAKDFSGVSCASTHGCLMVGSFSSQSVEGRPLGLWFDGRHWRDLRPPNPAESSSLSSASCTSSASCMAVGRQFVSRDQNALAERWNGHHWSTRVPPRPAGDGGAELAGVACRSRSHCTAVGASGPADPTGGLAEGWNGFSWTIQPTPGGDGWPLNGVACRPTFCVAVGSHAFHAIVERLS